MQASMLDAALEYARRGWPVFPLMSKGKLPLIAKHNGGNGHLDATTDEAKIREWWRRCPSANIGIACGPQSFCAIDVDPEKGGDKSYAELAAKHGEFPPTLRQISGSGGVHYCFKADPRIGSTISKVAKGIDTRGDNKGYVVAAPSIHPSGQPYQWENLGTPLASVPEWFVALLASKGKTHSQPPPVPTPTAAGTGTLAPSIEARARAYLETCEPAIQGQGGHAKLLWAARAMVQGFALDDGTAYNLLASIYNPRCVPPWNLGAGHDNREFRRKIEEAKKGGDKRFGWLRDEGGQANTTAMNQAREWADALIRSSTTRPTPPAGIPAQPRSTTTPAPEGGEDKPRVLRPRDLFNYRTDADPNTLLGQRWLCRGGSCLTVGATGRGKSSLDMQEAVLEALGLDFFGIRPVRPLKTLFVQAENDDGDLAEMFQGVVNGLKLTDRLPELENRLAFITDTQHAGAAFIPWVTRLIEEHRPDVVRIDPLYAFIGGNVSDQETVSTFLRNGLNPIAQKTGILWRITHHTNKPPLGKDRGTVQAMTAGDYSYFGAGSAELANWARAILVLLENADGAFTLRAAKRGNRAGLVDAAGQPTTEVFLKHSASGICWERATAPENVAAKADRAAAEDILAGFAGQPMPTRPAVVEACRKILGLSGVSSFYKPSGRASRVLNLVLAGLQNREG